MKSTVKNVPVILQMEAVECGAASLAMILAYYKKYIPLEELRNRCNVSRDGSSAKYIMLAARSYGMEAKVFKMGTKSVRELKTFRQLYIGILIILLFYVVLRGKRR